MDDYDVRKGRTYMYLTRAPAFPFGHGLSYTRFEYGDLSLSQTTVRADTTLRVELDVANVGKRAGAEVAQLYVRPPHGPKQELRAFQRVAIEPGAHRRVSFDLPMRDLAHYDLGAGREVIDPGRYEILVGGSSADVRRRTSFELGE
jgi:beta-glucosidase